MKLPRRLKNEEIMVKVDHLTEKDVTLVLYTKPTVIMNIMDETFGPDGWQVEHTAIPKGNGHMTMLCKVSVYDENRKTWISRDDAGEPVGSHSDKSQATDALKRACALFGVAKELKTMPEEIIVPAFRPKTDENNNAVKRNGFQETETLINITKNDDGTLSCMDRFSIVQYLLDDTGNICALCIKDDTTGKRIFTRDYRNNSIPKPSAIAPLSAAELARFSMLKADMGAFARKGNTIGELQPDELRWLFGRTKSTDIKRGCLEIAEAIPEYKEEFVTAGFNPDELLKEFREDR